MFDRRTGQEVKIPSADMVDVLRWLNEHDLKMGEDYIYFGIGFYGPDPSFVFLDHNLALRFKLTFGGH